MQWTSRVLRRQLCTFHDPYDPSVEGDLQKLRETSLVDISRMLSCFLIGYAWFIRITPPTKTFKTEPYRKHQTQLESVLVATRVESAIDCSLA